MRNKIDFERAKCIVSTMVNVSNVVYRLQRDADQYTSVQHVVQILLQKLEVAPGCRVTVHHPITCVHQ